MKICQGCESMYDSREYPNNCFMCGYLLREHYITNPQIQQKPSRGIGWFIAAFLLVILALYIRCQ